MKPNYPALAATILAISQETPLHLLRKDLISELFRRGVLELAANETLRLSGEGIAIVAILKIGGRAAAIEDQPPSANPADAADAILDRFFRAAG